MNDEYKKGEVIPTLVAEGQEELPGEEIISAAQDAAHVTQCLRDSTEGFVGDGLKEKQTDKPKCIRRLFPVPCCEVNKSLRLRGYLKRGPDGHEWLMTLTKNTAKNIEYATIAVKFCPECGNTLRRH